MKDLLLLFTLVTIVTISQAQQWIWDGQAWVQANPVTPAPTAAPRPVAAVPQWQWDGSRWIQIQPRPQPRPQPTQTPMSSAENDVERTVRDCTDCDKVRYLKQTAMARLGIQGTISTDFRKECLLNDMALNKQFVRSIDVVMRGRKKRTTIDFDNYPNQRWDNGVIPFLFDTTHEHTPGEKSQIRQAMAWWMQDTCIQFREVNAITPGAKLNITSTGTGCISFVGKGEMQPQSMFLPSSQCFQDAGGTTAHELGHAIGIWHEIQRSDRDNFVRVNTANVNSEEAGNFFVLPETVADTHGVPYDYSSLMHYDSFAFVQSGAGRVLSTIDPLYQKSIGQRVELSYYDIFKVNRAYCQNRCSNTIQCVRGHQNPNNCQRCVCPDGFGGTLCGDLAQSTAQCGGELVAGYQPNTLQSPGYPTQYNNGVQCVWRIRANPGYQVRARFTGNFGVYENEKETCFHWVEIKYTRDVTSAGPRFCGNFLPLDELTSETNELYVIFKSNYNTGDATGNANLRRGFQLQYQTTEPRPPSPCANNPCQNNGVCVEDNTAVNGYRCRCQPQWTGPTCLDPAECPEDACNSRAESCRINPNFPNSYFCECFAGYQGQDCQIDLCDNYCLNGGTCNRPSVVLIFEGQSSPTGQDPCTCPPAFTGPRCETPVITQCPPNAQCLNGGRCVPSNDRIRYPAGYYCDCMMGFLGDNCEIDVCTGRCGDHGTCTRLVIDNSPTAICTCEQGYSGDNCEIADCPPDACSNLGQCIPGAPPGSRNHPLSYYCDCFSGYQANQQRTDCSDPCAATPAPCGPGSCLRLAFDDNPYMCICPPGYNQPNCDPAPCTSSPCQNGGMCFSARDGYNCACRNGYTGTNCETAPPDPCSNSPCQNNGVCTNNVLMGGYSCRCRDGFSGRNCETRPNPCGDRPCSNGGICINNALTGTYSCLCNNGFTGDNCEISPVPCNDRPCRNGGICVNVGTSYSCICQNGFTGRECQTAPDVCASGPCLNGGFCRRTSNTAYTCSCRTGYSGRNCEIQDVCASRPCQNGGTCRNIGTTNFRCSCRNGFSGRLCEINVGLTTPGYDPCDSNPCQNGARCECLPDMTYVCHCRNGFTGTNCDNTPGPITEQCESRTCGGWDLEPGHHTTDICNGPTVSRIREVDTNCRWERQGGSRRYSRVCDKRQVEEQVTEHYCCNGALNVTALELRGQRDVPICVKPGWEPEWTECPSRAWCGGCSKQTRSRWGITIKQGCKVFERIETREQQCPSRMCTQCSYWEKICGQCADPGECCDNAVPQGNQCVPTGPRTRGNPRPTMQPIVTVDPTGFLPQRQQPRPRWPAVDDARWSTGDSSSDGH